VESSNQNLDNDADVNKLGDKANLVVSRPIQPDYLQNSDHASLWASSARLVAVVSQDVKPLKALEGPPHDLGQYYLLMDPGVSGEFFKRLQQVDGAVALDKGARMPGQGRREQDPVELENTVWELTLTLAGLK
jgi:hypothetical protein